MTDTRTRTRSTHTAERPAAFDRPLRATVTRVARTSPHVVTVTIGGPDLRGFRSAGPDEWFRLFLPREGQRRPLLPTAGGSGREWWEQVCAMPEADRPIVRNYTIRRHHPATDELDVEFMLHDDEGPASGWAARARPGDELGLLLQGAPYDASHPAPWRLLAGDETALPAMSAIVESLPTGARAHVFALVPEPADTRELTTLGDVHITWVCRDRVDGDGRAALVDAVRRASLPAGQPYAWLAGEAGLVRDLRRHLLGERGVDKDAVCFLAYWRHRDTDPAAVEA
ncbi:MAG TPA: siderophore-interacting protein [Egibacteraceae bacterium]